MAEKRKILLMPELAARLATLKKSGKRIVQSHGVYDLIHPGVINHLTEARALGDVLVVTVIKDKDVRRGPGRPIFDEANRALSVAALGMVDYVSVVDDEVPFEAVKALKPDVFARGVAFKERDRLVDAKLFEEEKEFYFGRAKIMETSGFSLSSTSIINNLLYLYPEETRAFLKDFSARHGFGDIKKLLDSLSNMRVLLIGDGIIDEYHYVHPMSKSAKAHLVVNKYLGHEIFAGGAFAIANHLSGLCKEVQLISLLGAEESREDYIRSQLRPNVTARFIYRPDGPTIVKKRYINQYLNQKLFEVNYINDAFVGEKTEREIGKALSTDLKKYDLVIVSDFGHGFLTDKTIKLLRKGARKLALNTQTNGANAGYNLVTRYHGPDLVCLDEPEVRLAAQDKFSDIESIAARVSSSIKAGTFMVTLGKRGSFCIDRKGQTNHTPVFSTKVLDTVGAGDAFFSFAAPAHAKGMPMDIVSFIGNAAGALSVQIMGNKKPVEKHELLNLIFTLLK